MNFCIVTSNTPSLPSARRTSLQFGISALKKVNYDRVALDDRRRSSEDDCSDVIVWTNERIIKWVAAIGLKVRGGEDMPSSVDASSITCATVPYLVR